MNSKKIVYQNAKNNDLLRKLSFTCIILTIISAIFLYIVSSYPSTSNINLLRALAIFLLLPGLIVPIAWFSFSLQKLVINPDGTLKVSNVFTSGSGKLKIADIQSIKLEEKQLQGARGMIGPDKRC